MPLSEIKLQPGIYTEQTDRGANGHWKDGEKIRFRYGLPEKLKGWIRYRDSGNNALTVTANARAVWDWSSLDGQKWAAVGCAQKLYLFNNATRYDITPLAAEGTLTNPFTTTNGSTTVTVTHASHGVLVGQLVTFSGASAVGGITINGSYTVVTVPTVDTYTITHVSAATSSATGGGTVNYQYEITPPLGTSGFVGVGYGPVGLDNDPNYIGTGVGTPRLASNLPQDLAIWSLDNWGEDLIACRRGGPIYVWDRSSGPNTRAQIISAAPSSNNWIIVSPEDRILISLGSHDGLQRDQSLIRWCSQEDYNDWTPSDSNTAGDKRLDSGSRIITGIRTRGEIVIWTDTSMYSMASSGTPGDFSFQPKGESLAIAGPNAKVEAGGVVYSMDKDEFMVYDGVSRILPCTVRNHVFDNIDRDGIEKVYAAVNKQESEVWFFYPSSGAADNDRYVVFNYREGVWYYGTLARTCYMDAGFEDYPIASDPSGNLFLHENGYKDDTAQMPAFIESYDQEINDIGETIAHIDKFIPDFLNLTGSVQVTFRTRKYPTAEAITKGPYPVSSATEKVNLRARGRQIAIKVADVTTVGNAADILELPAGSGLTLSGDNLTATQPVNAGWDTAYGDDGRTAGKYVFEMALSSPGATDPYNLYIGIANANTAGNLDPASPGGTTIRGFNASGYTPTRITIYADLDAGNGWIEVDGAMQSGDPNTGVDPSFTFNAADTWYPFVTLFNQISATYRSTDAAIAANIPDGWLPWAGTTETGVTTPSWRFGTLRVNVKPDGGR